MKTVRVLLSSYNGEKYIREQIDSVLQQEGVEIELLVRDDGSKDNTLAILEDYSRMDPRVSFYQGGNLGPCYSFIDLLRAEGSPDYYAFCDQDDVWDNDKLKCAIDMLETVNHEVPALYYSNLKVVDEKLDFCRNSFDKDRTIWNKYSSLVEFVAIGCTEVFNKALRDILINHVPSKCLMHDAWALTVCSFMGKSFYDSSPHIMYRQHQNNVIGTKKRKIDRVKDRLTRLFDKDLQPRLLNAESFFEQFSKELDNDDAIVVEKILNYKNNLGSKIDLLFERKIHTLSLDAEVRYRALIVLGLI